MMVHYTAKVQDTRLLELPEEAIDLGLKRGDEVQIIVEAPPANLFLDERLRERTPQERSTAFRAWAESHSTNVPLLSDDAISRETIYGDRG